MSVLYPALPQLSADLGAGSLQSLWIMDIYGYMIAGFLITMGTLGDRIGRRRMLMIGVGAFSVASVLAAYSTCAEMLIATRALLGIAGATLMPSTLALISNMFTDAHQRGVAIAVWMTSFMGGMTIGPHPIIGSDRREGRRAGKHRYHRLPRPAGCPRRRPGQPGGNGRRGDQGASSVAAQLPAGVGIQLLDTAREAFTAGLITAVGFGAVAFLALRHVRPAALADEDQTDNDTAVPAPQPEVC